jgi:chemotaxis methyl-accepting protein methylase
MDGFESLKWFIEHTLAIQCSQYKEDYIKRRLLSRMRSTDNASYEDYLTYLKAHILPSWRACETRLPSMSLNSTGTMMYTKP